MVPALQAQLQHAQQRGMDAVGAGSAVQRIQRLPAASEAAVLGGDSEEADSQIGDLLVELHGAAAYVQVALQMQQEQESPSRHKLCGGCGEAAVGLRNCGRRLLQVACLPACPLPADSCACLPTAITPKAADWPAHLPAHVPDHLLPLLAQSSPAPPSASRVLQRGVPARSLAGAQAALQAHARRGGWQELRRRGRGRSTAALHRYDHRNRSLLPAVSNACPAPSNPPPSWCLFKVPTPSTRMQQPMRRCCRLCHNIMLHLPPPPPIRRRSAHCWCMRCPPVSRPLQHPSARSLPVSTQQVCVCVLAPPSTPLCSSTLRGAARTLHWGRFEAAECRHQSLPLPNMFSIHSGRCMAWRWGRHDVGWG